MTVSLRRGGRGGKDRIPKAVGQHVGPSNTRREELKTGVGQPGGGANALFSFFWCVFFSILANLRLFRIFFWHFVFFVGVFRGSIFAYGTPMFGLVPQHAILFYDAMVGMWSPSMGFPRSPGDAKLGILAP